MSLKLNMTPSSVAKELTLACIKAWNEFTEFNTVDIVYLNKMYLYHESIRDLSPVAKEFVSGDDKIFEEEIKMSLL